MKKVFKSAVMLMAAFMLPLGFTSCSSDDDPVENNNDLQTRYMARMPWMPAMNFAMPSVQPTAK